MIKEAIIQHQNIITFYNIYNISQSDLLLIMEFIGHPSITAFHHDPEM